MARRRWPPPSWPPTGTRPASPTRALPARVQAGLAAERAHAFPEAQRHYQRALELWERVPDPGRPAGLDRVDLLARAAEAAAFTGATSGAIGLLEEALGPAWTRRRNRSGPPSLLARLGATAGRAGDEPARWPPTRRRSGCWPVRRRRPSAPACSPATPCADLMLADSHEGHSVLRGGDRGRPRRRRPGRGGSRARASWARCLDRPRDLDRAIACTWRPAGSPRRSATPRR